MEYPMRANLQQRLEQSHNGIDLSPLLDVVFILLIFFIVTSVFVKETGVEVEKPQAVSAQRLENTVIMIAITNKGDVVYDSTSIGVAGVRNTIEQLLQVRERSVVIQADEQVLTKLLVEVIDEAKLAGAKSVNIATAL
jgi:biopolymer transport protein ExbD